jgi:protein-tyrosine phosphatase
MTPHASTRDIALQGAANYRDLGGLRSADGRTLRPGRVLRGDSPHRLTPDDVAVLAGIGVRTVLDMRSEAEVELLPATPLPAGGEIVHTPWRPPASVPEILGGITERRFLPLAELYEWFVDANLDYLATMFRVFADPERHTVLFHCYAGKDRTGIVADYRATDDHRKRFAELTDSDSTELDFHLHDRAKVNPDLIFSPPKQMIDFLAIVARRWGSAEGLVRAAGLSDQEIASLRDSLLV